MIEVFYLRPDGVRVRGFAWYKPTGPFCYELVVGDGTPVKDLQQITRQEWFEGEWSCWRLFVQ